MCDQSFFVIVILSRVLIQLNQMNFLINSTFQVSYVMQGTSNGYVQSFHVASSKGLQIALVERNFYANHFDQHKYIVCS